MTTQNKVILTAVLAFIAAVILNLQTLGGVISNVLSSSQGGAGGSVASAGSGGTPRAGSGGTRAGTGGAGAVAASGSVAPVPAHGMALGAQSWFVADWSGNKLFSSLGVWNPQFLADLKPYSTFRHMDTNATNSSKQSSWSTRRLPTDPNQTAYGATDGDGGPGIAYEYQIDLCNKAKVNCWFCVPHLADDAYVTSLAALVKSKIDPTLKVYVEYSNETANGGFTQFAYVNKQGVALGLPGMNQYYQGSAFAVYRTLQIGKIFRDSGVPILLVFAYMGNLDTGSQALKTVLPSSKWNPSGQKIDVIAVAPYVAAPSTDGSTFTLAAWKSEVDKLANGEPIANALRDMKANGIPTLVAYEGGQTYYTNSNLFAKNPQAYDAYVYMLNTFESKGMSLFNAYTLYGTWGASAWGVFDHTGQALSDAPKARALVDFAASRR